MKKYKINNFTKGWIVGDFEPNIIRTKDFEFMVRFYNEGEKEMRHVHKIADEITVIIDGVFLMNKEKVIKGDIIHLKPEESTDFICVASGATAVIKTPSAIGDKFFIN
jgi:hypothetical protein